MVYVMVNFVQCRFAAADMIGDIFHIGESRRAGGHIHAGDIDADTMSFLKQVSSSQYLDGIFIDFTGNYRLLGFSGKGVPGLPWF